mmetsp:Transcript_3438/g.10008  ORF Transcript_3438/g.10008 Transcript_3438/m.10008 type:complete len:214 (-) Transcript_3438:1578-2219(-)
MGAQSWGRRFLAPRRGPRAGCWSPNALVLLAPPHCRPEVLHEAAPPFAHACRLDDLRRCHGIVVLTGSSGLPAGPSSAFWRGLHVPAEESALLDSLHCCRGRCVRRAIPPALPLGRWRHGASTVAPAGSALHGMPDNPSRGHVWLGALVRRLYASNGPRSRCPTLRCHPLRPARVPHHRASGSPGGALDGPELPGAVLETPPTAHSPPYGGPG